MNMRNFLGKLLLAGGAAALLAGAEARAQEYREIVPVPAQTLEFTDYHEVARGESVWKIAQAEFDLAPDDIMAIDAAKDRIVSDNPRVCRKNRGENDCDLLYVGDMLAVNKTGTVPAHDEAGRVVADLRDGGTYFAKGPDGSFAKTTYRAPAKAAAKSSPAPTPAGEKESRGYGLGLVVAGAAALLALGAGAYAAFRSGGRKKGELDDTFAHHQRHHQRYWDHRVSSMHGSNEALARIPAETNQRPPPDQRPLRSVERVVGSYEVAEPPAEPRAAEPRPVRQVVVGGEHIGDITTHGRMYPPGAVPLVVSGGHFRDALGPEHGGETGILSPEDSDALRKAAEIRAAAEKALDDKGRDDDDPDPDPAGGGGGRPRLNKTDAGGSEGGSGSTGEEQDYFNFDADSEYLRELMIMENNDNFDELGGDTRFLEYTGRNEMRRKGREVFNTKLAKELGVYGRIAQDIAHKYRIGMSAEKIAQEYRSTGVEISARTVGRLAKEVLKEEYDNIARERRARFFNGSAINHKSMPYALDGLALAA